MKRIRFIFSILLIFFAFAAFGAFSEDCDHAWSYTNNGESGHTASCPLCSQTRTDAHNLTYSKKSATCLSPAEISYACTLCSYTYSYTEGEKNPDHAWSEYVSVRKATCRESGIQSRTCRDCGQVESAEIAQLEHNYGDWKQYDEKWHIRYCKTCDWAYKGSHRLNDGEIIVKPTESQLGLVKYTCRVCSDTFENIMRIDGAIYAKEAEDVLGNGTKYLIAATGNEEDAGSHEIVLTSGASIDLRPTNESEFCVYASSATGNYAGICAESGETAIDVIPKADFETTDLEFLLIRKNASAVLRIFNASGALEIGDLDGARVIIAQHKNTDGTVCTLLMRLMEKRETIEGEAEIHISKGSVLKISNQNSKYTFTLPENSKKIASLTFKYNRSSGKITVSPRNHENNANGTSVHILEGIEFLQTAKNTKTAETTVHLTNEHGSWRLRASFPAGYTLETPLFHPDGTYVHKPIRYLMDEKALGALMLIDPMPCEPETQEESAVLTMPEAPSVTPTPTSAPAAAPSPAPTSAPEIEKPVFAPVSAPEANLLTDEPVSLLRNDKKAFAPGEYPEIIVQFDSMYFFISYAEDKDSPKVTSIKLVEQGASFKIQTGYSLPSEFSLSAGTTSVTISAQIKTANGKNTEISLGTYNISP